MGQQDSAGVGRQRRTRRCIRKALHRVARNIFHSLNTGRAAPMNSHIFHRQLRMPPSQQRQKCLLLLIMAMLGIWFCGEQPTLAQAPKERATLKGHTDSVSSVAFSPDGSTLASASGAYIGGKVGERGEIKLWDLATGREQASLGKYSRQIMCVAFRVCPISAPYAAARY